MADSWNDFLNIIGLEPQERKKAHLEVLLEFSSEEPAPDSLLVLFDHLQKILGAEYFTLLWWYDVSSEGRNSKNTRKPYTKLIGKQHVHELRNLWGQIAGDYLVFLPEGFDSAFDTEDEEAFIGMCLVKYSSLLLKTPDGHEVLYLRMIE